MAYFTFSAVMQVLLKHIPKAVSSSQLELMGTLFENYIKDTTPDRIIYSSTVNPWIKGRRPVAQELISRYSKPEHFQELVDALRTEILCQESVEKSLIIEELRDLLNNQTVQIVHPKKVRQLLGILDQEHDEAKFVAQVLLCSMIAPLESSQKKTGGRLFGKSLGQTRTSSIQDVPELSRWIPEPCAEFVGREKELEELYRLLKEKGHVFLSGAHGVGKSELLRALGQKCKGEFSQIVYVNVRPYETLEDSLARVDVRSCLMKTDGLLLIDNYNREEEQDPCLQDVLESPGFVLISTRCVFERYPSMVLQNLSEEALMRMMDLLIRMAPVEEPVKRELIQLVHGNTFALYLVSKLIDSEAYQPRELADLLRKDAMNRSSQEKVNVVKDNQQTVDTYYGQLHMLFALFRLEGGLQKIVSLMTIMPQYGISRSKLKDMAKLDTLNDVNRLVRLGLIREESNQKLNLHSLTRDVALADLPPTISGCEAVLQYIQWASVIDGLWIPLELQHDLFEIIDNIQNCAEKDDRRQYTAFMLAIVKFYLHYGDDTMMQNILEKDQELLKDKEVFTNERKAYLMCYQAMQMPPQKAIKHCKKALHHLKKCGRPTKEIGYLCANLHYQISQCYELLGQTEQMKFHEEMSWKVREQFKLEETFDWFTQGLQSCMRMIDEYKKNEMYGMASPDEDMMQKQQELRNRCQSRIMELENKVRGTMTEHSDMYYQVLRLMENYYFAVNDYERVFQLDKQANELRDLLTRPIPRPS